MQEDVAFLCFSLHILAYLPYAREEEPLFIIHHVNRVLSLSGASVTCKLKEQLENQEADITLSSRLPLLHCVGCITPMHFL